MRFFLFIAILTLAISGCDKEVTKNVDQDKIWTYYQLYFSEAENKTYATATFRFSNEHGTKLKLTDPSTVTVDGLEMEWNEAKAFYLKEFDGFKSPASFTWVDLDGTAFTNEVELRDIAFTMPVDTLFFSDSITQFMWAGLPLDSNESVSLTIDGVGATDTRIFTVDTLGATTITIDSLGLSQIDSGMVKMVFNLRYSPDLMEQTTRGGKRVGRYETDTVQTLLTN